MSKVIIAMSGGIDSSVSAALLKKAGFETIGVFMKFWSESQISADSNADLRRYENRCCSSEAETRARKVAEILKIPFFVFNFKKEFKKKVVDNFLDEYEKGRTPNPCVVCNKEIKFGFFLKKALQLNADFIATGHYARLRREIPNLIHQLADQIPNYKFKLLKGKDKKKDQSYFLWQLNQKQLKHIIFPVGNYTKDQVKKLAKKFKLSFLCNIPESQEICFVKETVNDFLRCHLSRQKPGQIITTDGKIIGQHQGLVFYTIGQRKGIKLAGGPFFVVKKDYQKNNLIVTSYLRDKNFLKKSLIAEKVNWISGQEPRLPSLKIKVQIRYGQKPVSATIVSRILNVSGVPKKLQVFSSERKRRILSYKLIFSRFQRAITPGQSVVFYSNFEIVGGGIISK